jgi:hypothetical protein
MTSTATFKDVAITRTTPSNQPPAITLTGPASGSTYTAPASITFSATASDADGSVAKVDFYANGQLVATDASSPYDATWSGVPQGSYDLTAIATDERGATGISAVTAVTVTSPTPTPTPTTVVFNPSPDHETDVTSYAVALYRAGDPVTATPVATKDLGKPTPSNNDISSDISGIVDPLPSGSYYAVVTAIGSERSSASAPSAEFTK